MMQRIKKKRETYPTGSSTSSTIPPNVSHMLNICRKTNLQLTLHYYHKQKFRINKFAHSDSLQWIQKRKRENWYQKYWLCIWIQLYRRTLSFWLSCIAKYQEKKSSLQHHTNKTSRFLNNWLLCLFQSHIKKRKEENQIALLNLKGLESFPYKDHHQRLNKLTFSN